MDEKYYNISYAESPFGTLNQYMTRTFVWMFAGLLVTFGVGVATLYSPLVSILFNSGLYLMLCIAELVMVVVLSARIDKLRPSTATSLFFGYAVLNGLNLSVIFAAYAFSTLVLAFLVGALYFGIMALYGSRTQKDLSSWGPMLSGALITLIIVGLLGGLLMFFMPGAFGAFLLSSPRRVSSTLTSPISSSNISAVIAPGRRIIGGVTVISRIVDSSPISTAPPSRIMSIFPSRSSATCSAVVGLGRPEVFALGADTNPPAARISS